MAVSSVSSESTLLQAAESSAKTAANTNTTTTSSTAGTTSALSSLAQNYTTFLTLLTTQLKNQDPSSPMSTDTFTSELAQFAGVEQQVETNTKLSSLISLNEEGQMSSDMSLVGQTATASSSVLPLQSGSAALKFSASSGQMVAISIANSGGTIVKDDLVSADSGTNTWTWDGKDNSGNQLADGGYNVAVKTPSSSGTVSDATFTVSGTITGIKKTSSGLEAEMGSATIPMSSISKVSNTGGSGTGSSGAGV
ncbi:flagellar biosynthesis protein FlgD [Acetobacter malorum]|uniref:Basal-body rod modification protein FlgD n=1 Tax=Acetobacter malorum TaxID=178901 RepID=A0A149VH37_9PROT|nr:flagellar hook capping FlgD N-terminal domain-containing protein [Acetobacter malorum]KXV79452.1 flagellar biosynthesis protein FlgD [Acetobacter malorum]